MDRRLDSRATIEQDGGEALKGCLAHVTIGF